MLAKTVHMDNIEAVVAQGMCSLELWFAPLFYALYIKIVLSAEVNLHVECGQCVFTMHSVPNEAMEKVLYLDRH